MKKTLRSVSHFFSILLCVCVLSCQHTEQKTSKLSLDKTTFVKEAAEPAKKLAQKATHAQPEEDKAQDQFLNSLAPAAGLDKKIHDEKKEGEIRVFVDAGHGGKDSGAWGISKLSEKDIVLKIAKQARKRLYLLSAVTGQNINVKLSREKDAYLSLKKRVQMANDWNADLFISIHANSSPVRKVRGFEVYFLSNEATDKQASQLALSENGGKLPQIESPVMSLLSEVRQNHHVRESFVFAEVMYSALSSSLRPNGRAVRQGPFTVLHGTQMPALLVEVGYLTHDIDSKSLATFTYQKKVAHAISSGIAKYIMREFQGVSL